MSGKGNFKGQFPGMDEFRIWDIWEKQQLECSEEWEAGGGGGVVGEQNQAGKQIK